MEATVIKFSENGLELTLFLSSETPSKKERLEFGNQRLNRFQQLDPMAEVSRLQVFYRLNSCCKCPLNCLYTL